jgi:hypothetical protein
LPIPLLTVVWCAEIGAHGVGLFSPAGTSRPTRRGKTHLIFAPKSSMRLMRLMRRRVFFPGGAPLLHDCFCLHADLCLPTSRRCWCLHAQGTLCSASFVEVQRSAYPPVQGRIVLHGVSGSIGFAAAAETCTHRSGELLPSADAQGQCGHAQHRRAERGPQLVSHRQ